MAEALIDKLCNGQQSLYEFCREAHERDRSYSIINNGHPKVREALLAYFSSFKRVLILALDEDGVRGWSELLRLYFPEDDFGYWRSGLELEEWRFVLVNYRQFSRHEAVSSHHKKDLIEAYKKDLISIRSCDFLETVGECDAFIEAEAQANFEAIRRLNQFNRRLLKYYSSETEFAISFDLPAFIELLQEGGVDLLVFDSLEELDGTLLEIATLFYDSLASSKTVALCRFLLLENKFDKVYQQFYKNLKGADTLDTKWLKFDDESASHPYRELLYCSRLDDEENLIVHDLSVSWQRVYQEMEGQWVDVSLSEYVQDSLYGMAPNASMWLKRRRDFIKSCLSYAHYLKLKVPEHWAADIHDWESGLEAWLPLLHDYVYKDLMLRDARHQQLGENILRGLYFLGYELSLSEIQRAPSIVRNILARSISKYESLYRCIEGEFGELKVGFRGLVLCDFFENSSADVVFSRNAIPNENGGQLGVLKFLNERVLTQQLNPLVFCLNRLYCLNKFRELVGTHLEDWIASEGLKVKFKRDSGEVYTCFEFEGFDWSHRVKVEFLNLLGSGSLSQLLILNREFLTESWDGLEFNTLFNFSSGVSELFAERLESRMLEAWNCGADACHLWDFVTVHDDAFFGLVDFHRVGRRKSFIWNIKDDGCFEKGLHHFMPQLQYVKVCDDALIEEINEKSLGYIAEREESAALWLSPEFQADSSYVIELDFSEKESSFRLDRLGEESGEVKPKDFILQIIENIYDSLGMCGKVPEGVNGEFYVESHSAGLYNIHMSFSDEKVFKTMREALADVFDDFEHQLYAATLRVAKHKSSFFSLLSSHSEFVEVPFGVPSIFSTREELDIFWSNWQELSKSNFILLQKGDGGGELEGLVGALEEGYKPRYAFYRLLR